jgi:GNAT superfamily N-acetyltransferase
MSRDRPDAHVLAAEILTWTEGWICSRGLASPTPIRGGVHIRVGSDAESARYVLTAPDTERAHALTSQVTEPMFWIKWPAADGEVEPAMPAGWRLVEPQFLMRSQLARTAPLLPDGYRLVLDDEGDAVEARVVTDTGSLAASGRIGLTTLAVPDQIVTQEAHQRRGLGRAVMCALSNAALDHGRSDAVLLASGQGRQLYTALGWHVVSPFWAAIHHG